MTPVHKCRQDLTEFFRLNQVLTEPLGQSPGARRAYDDAVAGSLDPPLTVGDEHELIRYPDEPSRDQVHVLQSRHVIVDVESWGLAPDLSLPYMIFNAHEPDGVVRFSLLLLRGDTEDFLGQSPYVPFRLMLVHGPSLSMIRLLDFAHHFKLNRPLVGPACLAAYELAKAKHAL